MNLTHVARPLTTVVVSTAGLVYYSGATGGFLTTMAVIASVSVAHVAANKLRDCDSSKSTHGLSAALDHHTTKHHSEAGADGRPSSV